jgi:two-component system, OmpR family, alkaline phosphatase synthesis response regulator PhoP
MTTTKSKILLVDDEPDILEFIRYNLEKEGFEVYTASNGKDAVKVAEKEMPSLIILDVMMPDMDGVETCVRMRENTKLNGSLITFLTARNEDYTQIAGFDAGADDYITKPIKPRVLVSRVKALLRRASGASKEENSLQDLGGLVIDRDKYVIFKNGVEINLPKKEFELLALLASKPGNVFPREMILENVWGGEVIVGDRTIDVHVRKLREKIGEDYIKTIKGVGYKFDFR